MNIRPKASVSTVHTTTQLQLNVKNHVTSPLSCYWWIIGRCGDDWMSSVRSCYEMSYNSGGVGSWTCVISGNISLGSGYVGLEFSFEIVKV